MIAIIYGLICGIALSLTGGGGSILAVPMLIYGIKLSFHQAVSVSLLVVGLIALIGLLLKIKKSEVEWVAGILLALTGMIFAPIGSYISSFMNSNLLSIVFAVLMLIVGFVTWMKSKNIQVASNISEHYDANGKLSLTKRSVSLLLLAGIITGFLTGMLGVGGGFLIVPALMLAIRMPIKKAIATSLLVIFLVSMSGFIAHMHHTVIPWDIAGYFILGGLVGMFGASKLKDMINGKTLQKIFAVLLVILGVAMIAVHTL